MLLCTMTDPNIVENRNLDIITSNNQSVQFQSPFRSGNIRYIISIFACVYVCMLNFDRCILHLHTHMVNVLNILAVINCCNIAL